MSSAETRGGGHASRLKRVLAVGVAALLAGGGTVMTAPSASAAPVPGASASPTSVPRYGVSTVTLTLDGESSTQSTPTDLVLVLDESGSIDSGEFAQLRTFADDVVEAVAADGLFTNGGRVGVIGFSSGSHVVAPLSGDQTLVRNAIAANPQAGGGTCIACGMDAARSLLSPLDSGRSELVIVITDGEATAGDTAGSAASLQADATVFAVGVGNGINQSTLETIATGAGSANTFAVSGFGTLAALLETLVAAVVVPGATNPSITVALAPGWDLSGAPTENLGGGIAATGPDGFTWTRSSLGDEDLVITYDVVHEGAPCGPLPVNDSVAYSDDEGAAVVFPPVVVDVTCLPPVADAGPDVAVAEGSTTPLVGSGHDTDGTVVSYAWSGADPAIGSLSGTALSTASYAGLDDGADEVTLTLTDDNDLTGSDTATMTVTNVAPDVTLTSCPVEPNAVGAAVGFAGGFTDPGAADTHTLAVDWGDGSPVTTAPVAGAVGGSHAYAAAGIYEITATVTDDDGGSDTATCGFVVVYDPNGGFVTGGGSIDSPAGAYPADPTLSGRANFGFVSKYKKGADTPTGSTEFQFQAGSVNFHSSAYEWLVIAGSKAQFKGSGTLNGDGGYGFMLTARDASPDRFRMKIWRVADSVVVYDNQVGSADTSEPSTALTRGSIVVHKN